MAQLQVELFGAFRLLDEGAREIPVRSTKLRALIAYLAVHCDQPVKREVLAGLLWGDSQDDQARRSLRQALLSLRRTLGDSAGAFDADDETVTLQSAAARVDVALFERAAAEGRLAAAAALYRGDLMDEPSLSAEPFEAWLARERTRLSELACGTLEAYIEGLLEEGDAAAAVEAGKRLEALDPWRETGTRLLMTAYAQAGRRAEALKHYRAFSETLERELGTQPDVETTRLFDEIRDGVSSPTPESGRSKATEPSGRSDRSDRDEPAAEARTKVWRWAVAATVAIAAVAGWAVWQTYLRGSPSGPEAGPSPVATAPWSDKPFIAVLPFTNMSGDVEQEYFADGMTEDIITGLSKFEMFFVVSRNSSFTYKGSSVDVKEVARELGVQYVLEGSDRRSDDRLRITAQLIDAVADTHVWAERYDRDLEDLFQVQDEITQSIVASVAPEYFSAELRRAQRKEEQNLDAWDAFMRGYWHHLRFTKDDNAEAQRLLRKAIALDQRQAKYHGLLAVAQIIEGFYGWSESRDASFKEALANAERGLALDDQNTQVLRSIGLVHFFSKNHDLAFSYYQRAVAANPNEAENRALFGAALGVAGEYDAALEQFETAMRLSPRDSHMATWYNYLGIAAFVAGQDEKATEWARKTVEANPQFPGGYRTLAASAGNQGQLAEAKAARERLQELLPHLNLGQLREGLPYFKNPDDLERYLDGLRKAGLPE